MMRSLLFEELSRDEVSRLTNALEKKGYKGSIQDIYWFELPEEILEPIQKKHLSSCGPYIFSLETGKTWLRLELLVRPKNVLRCQCLKYASPGQLEYVLNLLQGIFDELNLKI